MFYPTDLVQEQSYKDFIDLFGGYNHNVRIQDNEFYDMENLTSDNYPTLSPRKKRGIPNIQEPEYYLKNTRGLLYKSDLYQVTTNEGAISLIKNGTLFVTLNNGNVDTDAERQLVMMGAYIIVLPDKVYFNITDPSDCGEIETSFESSSGDVIRALPCDIDGETYEINGVGDTIPEKVWDGFVWLDTNENPCVLKKYTVTNSTWSIIDTTYIRITCNGIGEKFKKGDGVDISGFVGEDTRKLNGSTIIQSVIDNNNVIIKGVLEAVQKEYTLKVHTSQKLSEENRGFYAYCDSALTENALANKEIIVGGKKMMCLSNSTPTLSPERKVSEDEKKWLADGSPTLTVAYDAINTTILYVYSSYEGVEGVNSNYLQGGVIVMLGQNGECVGVVSVGTGVQGNNGVVKLHLQQPVTVKAGTIIYPVDEFVSDSLYVTLVTASSNELIQRGDGISVSLDNVWNQTEPITISRTMPTLDYVIESNNRLWGCRCGTDNKGNYVNQIYASALGDFKNWSVYEGTSADSYYASVGTSGPFTGAINYMGYPVFFKEDCIHTVYGAYPAQYQINNMVCRGVQQGSNRSLAVVNETLYYLSNDGVMAYTGALPTCISHQLGNDNFKNGIACGYKNKYYISLEDSTDTEHLFILDVKYGTWYKENGINPKELLTSKNDVLYLSAEDNGLRSLFATGEATEEQVEWFAESGVFGHDYVNKKYITRINVRMSLGLGSNVDFYIDYNSSGEWVRVASLLGNNLNSFDIPIKPMRCDHFKIRIVGKGEAKIFSISKTIEQGSEL